MSYPLQLLILCPLIFFASFVDAVAGGGGLVSLPAYMLTGLPMHAVYGSNKFSACVGTAFAAARFQKSGRIHLTAALWAAAFALVGAAAGARVNLLIDGTVIKKIFLCLLPAIALAVLSGRKQSGTKLRCGGGKLRALCACIGFVIGLYDGLIGPGTGTFLIFCYTGLLGFDDVTASGNAKVVNLASNLASLVVYFAAGQVMFRLALPAAAASILGGLAGSGTAIKKGSAFIRVMLMLVLSAVFLRLAADVFI